jgi:hypothetical protein
MDEGREGERFCSEIMLIASVVEVEMFFFGVLR